MSNPKQVFLEVKHQEDSKKSFDFDHAQRIMTIQEKLGRHDWVLSEGQNLILENGSIKPRGNTKTSKDVKAK